ncbi:hypothetical protein BX666DRAFT_2121220 [Dichotomocladium elegans]|nr:hypothetical protein BX666DRAFT_2121220 [Dichotomocladium elegans]
MFAAALNRLKAYSPFFSLKSQEASLSSKNISGVCSDNGAGLLANASMASSSSLPPLSPPPYEEINDPQSRNSMLDIKFVQQSITLLQLATEMPSTMAAVDVYLAGLEKGLSSKVATDPRTRAALAAKLTQIAEKYKLVDLQEAADSDGRRNKMNRPSVHIVATTVTSFVESLVMRAAVALKQSPVPGKICCYLYWIMVLMVQSVLDVADKYQLRQRIWRGFLGWGARMMDFDQEYQIHQTLFTIVYTGFLTLCKACIAYSEAPGYHDQK